MTATNPSTIVCPQCHGVNTMVGASGLGMCFECSHQWNPDEVVAMGRPRPTPAPEPPTVPAPEPEPATTDADVETYFASLSGARVMVNGHDTATFVAFPVDGMALVEHDDGTQALVDMEHVEPVTDTPDIATVGADDIDADTAAAFSGATIALSNLIVRAGINHGWQVGSTELADLLAGVVEMAYSTTQELAAQTPTDDMQEATNTDNEGVTQ